MVPVLMADYQGSVKATGPEGWWITILRLPNIRISMSN